MQISFKLVYVDTLNVRKNGDQTHLVGKKWNMIPKKENAYSNLAIFGQDIEWYYALCVTFYTYNSFLCQLSSWIFVGIGQMLDICYKNMWKFAKKNWCLKILFSEHGWPPVNDYAFL